MTKFACLQIFTSPWRRRIGDESGTTWPVTNTYIYRLAKAVNVAGSKAVPNRRQGKYTISIYREPSR